MRDKEEYWNPILETMPMEKLQRLQLQKFKNIFSWAYEHSKFHRKLYTDAGIEPGDIRTFDDIRRVPKAEKSMLRNIQEKAPYPFGDILCVPLEEVTEYHQTSGTTGRSVRQADTWQDWDWMAEGFAYTLYAQGYRDTDRVFISFGYSTFPAWWAGHYGAEKMGCEVVPGGQLSTEARILRMQELKATALMITPTYALHMADVARSKLGIDPAKDLNIEKMTVSGEPGGSIPTTKRRIEEAWGAKVYDELGATEIGPWGYECQCQSGVHVNEALFLLEVEDPVTGELVTEPGKMGKMVITTFDRLAQPCIRFDSKDMLQLSLNECECGRTFRLFPGGVIGRADDITKVKGVLLAPTSIEEVVRGIPELSDEYEVVVIKKGDMDDITLKVEPMPGQESNTDAIEAKLVDQLRTKTMLRYNLEFVEYGSLPRSEGKAKRFKDLRKKE